tara:strand:- start:24 stop:230 length:207 start_codon:yes stop_codon:yes gene_type:complete
MAADACNKLAEKRNWGFKLTPDSWELIGEAMDAAKSDFRARLEHREVVHKKVAGRSLRSTDNRAKLGR